MIETIINNNENISTVNLGHMRPHRLVPAMETSVGMARLYKKKRQYIMQYLFTLFTQD